MSRKQERARASHAATARAAYTLFEVLLVVTLLAILASVVVPAAQTQPTLTLKAAARTLVSDLRYARTLAIQYNRAVVVQFNTTDGTYEIAWAEDDGLPMPRPLASAPASSESGPIRRSLNASNGRGFRSTRFVFAAIYRSPSQAPVEDVTFQPTGGTGPARPEDTIIWIAQGTGASARFIKTRISWVTGLVWVGAPTSQFAVAQSGGDRTTASALVQTTCPRTVSAVLHRDRLRSVGTGGARQRT